MAFSASADSSRAQLAYVAETTVGVTPATPQMKNLRMTGESLNAARTSNSSQEIRSDRNIADLITVSETSTGDINIEHSYGEYDDFLEAVMQGTWTANVLKNGTARRSFTIEKFFTDVSKGEVFTGCELTTYSHAAAQGAFFTGNFGVMARGSAPSTVVLDSTPTASLTNPVYNLTNHMTGVTINGVAYPDGIQNLSMAYNNAAREQRQIGSKNLAGVGMGTFSVTGSMTAYFGSATAIEAAYTSDTPVSLSYTLTNAGGSYTFTYPKVKFSSRTVVAGAINQDVVLALNMQPIFDSVTGCTVQITRTPA